MFTFVTHGGKTFTISKGNFEEFQFEAIHSTDSGPLKVDSAQLTPATQLKHLCCAGMIVLAAFGYVERNVYFCYTRRENLYDLKGKF